MKRLGLLVMLLGIVAFTVGCPAEPETKPGVDVGGGYTTPEVPVTEVAGEEPAEGAEGSGNDSPTADPEEGSGSGETDSAEPQPAADAAVTPPAVIPPAEESSKVEEPKSE